MATKTQAIAHLDGYMQKFPNTKNHQWYVGIASDVRQRLFNDHAVDEKNGAWAYIPADNHQVARETEQAYLAAGCDGGAGGGDHTTKTVYVYLKTTSTDP